MSESMTSLCDKKRQIAEITRASLRRRGFTDEQIEAEVKRFYRAIGARNA